MGERLTVPQRRALEELAAIVRDGKTKQAFWYPNGAGEHRTAEALRKKGLLTLHHRPQTYEITAAGVASVAA